jgi:hypothetical protein
MSTNGGEAAPGSAPAHLHLPDEPAGRREHWRAAVLDGKDLSDVVGGGDDGVAGWLWARWSTLAAHGMGEEAFSTVVVDYRRELWLWLTGDRLWEQCCSGLIGRIGRRVDAENSIEPLTLTSTTYTSRRSGSR